MIDLNQPNMQPENNIVKNLVYSGSKQNVKLTMVMEKFYMKTRNLTSALTRQIFTAVQMRSSAV